MPGYRVGVGGIGSAGTGGAGGGGPGSGVGLGFGTMAIGKLLGNLTLSEAVQGQGVPACARKDASKKRPRNAGPRFRGGNDARMNSLRSNAT